MPVEIERKFLVANDDWRGQVSRSVRYVQGYLADTGKLTLRARIEGDVARINIKSAGLDIERLEFEYEIPVEHASEMLERLCGDAKVSKTRHFVKTPDALFEVDEFDGLNTGLVMAEVELESRDQEFTRPDWLGQEVSKDPRYLNNNLAKKPFTTW